MVSYRHLHEVKVKVSQDADFNEDPGAPFEQKNNLVKLELETTASLLWVSMGEKGSWPGGYRSGQNVLCEVVRPLEDGYRLQLDRTDKSGFIRTKARLKPGDIVLATFICWSPSYQLCLLVPSLGAEKLASAGASPSPN